jgi:cysteinyl-tRNA synthetase
MYHCGPTVYDYLHIGNMRTFVFADTLRRMFEFSGYKVNQVINLTDVGHIVADADTGDDKIEKAAKSNNKSAEEIANYFADIFFADLEKLNSNTDGTIFPRATDNIPEQIALIQKLEDAGHTYKTDDGIYFDVSTYEQYGKLGNIDLSGLDAGHRVEFNSEKHTPHDFALWKFSPTDEKRQQEWESPWGVGFPGWHIECSAMAQKYLGETFDIHTGGVDLMSPHHNNEIAQSECANHAPLAHIWMHGAFLNWKDRKMSKSDGSFVTVADLERDGITPLSYRYSILQTRYRQPIFFSMEDIQGAHTAYGRLKNRVQDILKHDKEVDEKEIEKNIADIIQNDLDTPKLLAYLWELVNAESVNRNIVEKFDALLGLKLLEQTIIPDDVLTLKAERDIARAHKDFAKSDELRDAIKKAGYLVLDTLDGSELVKG